MSIGHLYAQTAARASALADGFESGAYEISDYNTACYFALAGNKQLALIYLRKAVEDGFSNPKAMLEDGDLTALHTEAGWSSILKKVQENEKRKANTDHLFFNRPDFWNSKFFQTPYRENLSEDEKLAGLSKFWAEAKYNFVNFDLIPEVNASTPQDRDVRGFDYALLAGSLTESIDLKLADEKGSISSQTISRVRPAERSEKLSYPAVVYKTLPGQVSYLAINSFATDTGSKVFAEKYPEIAQSKAIILDLRNNGGGSTDWSILRYFIDTITMVHKMYSRQYVPTQRAWGQPQRVWESADAIAPYKGHLYSKPVVVLTSARTFSAAEDFVAAFKSLQRGLIIGEATGGSTGQPLDISLPGNLTARICTKRDQYPDGEDFVGKGIMPDITVAPTISDVRKGIDTQLEAALRALKKGGR